MATKKSKLNKVPNLRFPRFEGEWEEKKLGELLEFKNGINASKEHYGKGVKFINVLDILNNDFITYENIVGQVDVDEATVEKYSVKYGDILFQRSSETREEVGTANVYLDKKRTATFGGFVIRGRRNGDYDPVFFNKLLKTDAARDSITSKSGGSTRYNVGQEVLSSIELVLPPLIEQQKVGCFLSFIDDRIQTQIKIIEDLTLQKNSLRKMIFKRYLRFPKFNNEWKVQRLAEVCDIIGGGTPETGTAENWNGNIQWFTPTEIKANYVSKSERTITQVGLKNSSAKVLPKGTILLTTRATIGEAAIALEECTTNQGFQSLITKIGFNNIFLFNWIKENKQELIKRANGSTFPEISKSEIEKIEIETPTLEEQTKIARFLLAIDNKLETESAISQLLLKQKRYFLQNLFI